MNIDRRPRPMQHGLLKLLLLSLVFSAASTRQASAQMARDSYRDWRLYRSANGDLIQLDGRIDPERSIHDRFVVPRLQLRLVRSGRAMFRPTGTTGVSTWTGGTGTWSDGSMWNPTGAPNDNGADVFLDNGNMTNSAVSLSGNFTVGRLTIDVGDSLSIENNSTLSVAEGAFTGSGTILNNGSITLASVGNTTDLRLTSGDVSLTGGGTITLSNTSANRIYGVSGNERLTIGASQTIQGAGQLGLNQLFVTNQGTIIANAGGGLAIDPTGDANSGAAGFVNLGTLRATNGATLTLLSGRYDNAGGNIIAEANSIVLFSGTNRVSGGNLVTNANGEVQFTGSNVVAGSTLTGAGIFRNNQSQTLTLDGASAGQVTIAGSFVADNNSTTNLTGTINNTGGITLASIGNSTDLRLTSGDVSLTGAGTITMSNNSANRIYGASGNERLTIGVNQTIQGAGQLGLNQLFVTNQGMVIANQSAGVTIDPGNGNSGTAAFVNLGTLRASNGATLTLLSGRYDNTGGNITADASSLVWFRDTNTVIGGTISAGTGAEVQFSGNNTVSGGTLNGAGIFRNNQSQTLTLDGSGMGGLIVNARFIADNNSATNLIGTVTNTGGITLVSIGNSTDLRLTNGDVSLTGSGTITMSNNSANRIYGVSGNERLTIGANQTIQGAGQLGVNQTFITNQGTIIANQSAGVTIDPTGNGNSGTAGFLNLGTLRASNGATMTLLNGRFDNTGGNIIADALSLVFFSDTNTVVGGTMSAGTGAEVQFSGNNTVSGGTLNGPGIFRNNQSQTLTLDGSGMGGLILNAQFVADNNSTTNLIGTITNTGGITLASVGNTTDLHLTSGDVSLTGSGTITMSNNSANRIYGVSGNERLTIGANQTIQGSGQLGVNQIFVTNQGTIIANQSAGFTIDPTADGNSGTAGFVNLGTLRATSGATMTLLNGRFDNTGGNITAEASSLVFFSGTNTVIGGTISAGAGAEVQFSGNNVVRGGTLNGPGIFRNNQSQTLTLDGSGMGGLILNAQFIAENNSATNLIGTITNNGGMTLASVGNTTDLHLTNGDVTLSGNGTLTGSNTLANRVYALNGTDTLTNGASHTINGTMQLGINSMNLINNGVIDSNTSNITIDPASTAVNNASGVFRASNNATLLLTGGTFTNNGTYEALTGSVLQMSNSAGLTNYDSGTMTMTGGTYRAVSTGAQATLNLNIGQMVNNAAGIVLDGANTIIHTSDNTTDALRDFNNNTAAGSFTITNGRNFDRTFAFNNAGVTTIGPSSLFTTVQFDLSGTLTGAGTLTDSGPFNWTAGTQSGTGITNANGGMGLGGGTKTFISRTVNNNGAAAWSAGNFSSGLGAIFNNSLGSSFTDSFDGNWLFDQGGAIAQFNNLGTFTKSAGSGTTLLQLGFNNSGTLNANSGTLSFSQGVQGTSGTVNVASGATLNVSGGTTASSAATLNLNGSLSLGSNNFSVAVDYTNANFGSGNSFNPRANVTGTGGINATGSVNQTVAGDATGGTTTTPSIAFGNFHVGDSSVTRNYAINNTGSSGPSLRGAIQTSVNGGNITDSRLSGSGVTAANWGPLSTGASTSNFAVNFNPSSAGGLSGQVIHLVNNFDNVQEQNVALTGSVYRLAAASAHTPEPVAFGVVHVGDTVGQSLSVTNTAANDGFSEKLDGGIAPTTGGVTASGSFSLLNPGSTSAALSVGINTAAAGIKNGTATISLVSNGSGTSGLSNTNLTSQTVNVTGQVNFFADPVIIFKSGSATLTMQSPTQFTLDFGSVQPNSGNYMAMFGVQNFLHDAVFQDSLGGQFDISMIGNFGASGTDPFSGIGPNSEVDPSVSFNSAMAVGTYTGRITVNPTSTNTSGTSNLNAIQLNLTATIIPEPSSWALGAAGGSLLVALQRFRRRR